MLIVHGCYPFSMIGNSAVKDLLVDLNIVPKDFDDLPDRTTITRHVNRYLDTEEQKVSQLLEELIIIKKYKFSASFDEWESSQKLSYMCVMVHVIDPVTCISFQLVGIK